MFSQDGDVIAAIATAPGRGGIGVVRVSGSDLKPFLDVVSLRVPEARHATYCVFRDTQGRVIDRGLLLYFPGPHSYTGEDVVELQVHGGPVVLQMLLRRCLDIGAALMSQPKLQSLAQPANATGSIRSPRYRLAEPGEFTLRAFLNGKLDLAQAEAVADLIEAGSEAAVRSAEASLSGGFSYRVRSLVDGLIHLRMLIEATLDFPEEDIDFLQQADADGQLKALEMQFVDLLDRSMQGALLRDGLKVVLVGRPNVGKSSLLNRLADADIAIVTAIPGTTRDKVVSTIHIEGIPLHIIDTAGLRDTNDEVERLGIERTWTEIRGADVILHIREAGTSVDEEDAMLAARFPERIARRTVVNKIDLVGEAGRVDAETIYLSAKSGEGVDLLRAALLAIAGWHPSEESVFLARERHLIALRAGREHLAHATSLLQEGRVLELTAEELRLAQEQLNRITGSFGADDLLGEIFSRFCIGK